MRARSLASSMSLRATRMQIPPNDLCRMPTSASLSMRRWSSCRAEREDAASASSSSIGNTLSPSTSNRAYQAPRWSGAPSQSAGHASAFSPTAFMSATMRSTRSARSSTRSGYAAQSRATMRRGVRCRSGSCENSLRRRSRQKRTGPLGVSGSGGSWISTGGSALA